MISLSDTYWKHLISIMSNLPAVTNDRPRLPIELCEQVIDYASDGRHLLSTRTVLACCLTCRSWLPRGQYRLYQYIDIYTSTKLQSVNAALQSRRSLFPLVRYLWVRTDNPDEEKDCIPALSITLFFPRPLKNLRTLHFDNISLISTHSYFFRALPLHTSVTTLSLVRVSFSMGSQLTRLIRCFPSLSMLNVRWVTFAYDNTDTFSAVGMPRNKISSLSQFQFSGHARHLESMITLDIPVAIRNVENVLVSTKIVDAAVSRAIIRCGPCLFHLTLGCSYSTQYPDPFGE